MNRLSYLVRWIIILSKDSLDICKILTIQLHLYPLSYDAINMANTNEIYPENFDDNNSFKVNTLSALLSGVKTKTNISLILITYII